MTPYSDQDIVKATARGRILSAAGFVLALGIIALFQYAAMPIVNASLASNPTPGTVKMLKWIFAGFASLSLLPSATMILIGRKIMQRGQYPLPNAWVWHDTPVKYGDKAKRMGKLCITAGTSAGIISIILLACIWMVFDKHPATLRLRPGITILQTPTIKPETPLR